MMFSAELSLVRELLSGPGLWTEAGVCASTTGLGETKLPLFGGLLMGGGRLWPFAPIDTRRMSPIYIYARDRLVA